MGKQNNFRKRSARLHTADETPAASSTGAEFFLPWHHGCGPRWPQTDNPDRAIVIFTAHRIGLIANEQELALKRRTFDGL
ncbi:MAG: hypothetical protein K6T49_10445, partial [Acidobacterium ailaaui]|nr:hypothetical protein [Pseudacidobacterium ailaaui]